MLQHSVEYEPVNGVEYLSDRLNEGVCGVSISSTQQDHYGSWSSTLIAIEGQVLRGTIEVRGEGLSIIFTASLVNSAACRDFDTKILRLRNSSLLHNEWRRCQRSSNANFASFDFGG